MATWIPNHCFLKKFLEIIFLFDYVIHCEYVVILCNMTYFVTKFVTILWHKFVTKIVLYPDVRITKSLINIKKSIYK